MSWRQNLTIAFLLIGTSAANAADARPKEQRSPDGKFAAVHVSEEEGSENANGHVSLIELPSRRVVVPRFMIDVGVAERLWWSPNSRRFAIYARPGTRVGAMAVYEWEGGEFREIELPEIESAWSDKREEAIAGRTAGLRWEEARATRRIEDSIKPVRWLSAEALLLELRYVNIYQKEGSELTKRIPRALRSSRNIPRRSESGTDSELERDQSLSGVDGRADETGCRFRGANLRWRDHFFRAESSLMRSLAVSISSCRRLASLCHGLKSAASSGRPVATHSAQFSSRSVDCFKATSQTWR